MAPQFLLQGNVKWSYDHELAQMSTAQHIMAGINSFAQPLHHHKGYIALSDTELIIEGEDENTDDYLTIPLSAIKQVYLGFDELFTALSVKNLGMFWQPLRIEYATATTPTQFIYLVIDYNGLYTHDKGWFNALTQMLR